MTEVKKEDLEIAKEVQYWAGMLIGHEQAYDIAEEIVNTIKSVEAKFNHVDLANITQWVANETLPDYDGNYLCYIHQPQECDNVWGYYKTVKRESNKWILDTDEVVVYWTDKAFPIGISPEPPCG